MWYSIKVTAIVSVFGQMVKSRLCNLVHNELFIALHRSRRGAWIYVWVTVLLPGIMHLCWVNVTSFLEVLEPEERPPVHYSRGFGPVLQVIGGVLVPISSSSLTSRGQSCAESGFFDTQRCVSGTGKSLLPL